MRIKLTWLVVFLLVCSAWVSLTQPVFAQDVSGSPTPGSTIETGSDVNISETPSADGVYSPTEGSFLSGVLDIKGTVHSAWDLSFSYRQNSTLGWFFLSQSSEPISNGILASWDTNSITDGNYVLRLRIFSTNEPREILVNVTVRNKPLIVNASSTPSPTIVFTATETTRPTQIATPQVEDLQPLPLATTVISSRYPNPAVLDSSDIFNNLGKGMLVVLVVFGFAGITRLLARK